MIKETEKPLGREPAPNPRKPRRISLRGAALAGAAVVLVAASAAIALAPTPFRHPSRAVVSAPQVAAAPNTPKAAAAQASATAPTDLARTELQQSGNGPKIIHVPASAHRGAEDAGAMAAGDHFSQLPDRALIEESEMGPLPVRAADGTRPLDVYARPAPAGDGPRIAIVLGGLGLSQTGTQEAIDQLPPTVTLAFAPQGNSLDRWMRDARAAGHELLMQVPLEPYNYPNVNPGRNTLTVGATPGQTLHQLRWALSRITNYTGVMNYMGGRFTADPDAMDTLMDEIGERGLLYLDDGTSTDSLAQQYAAKDAVPFARADVVIDEERDPEAILGKLADLEALAKANGQAIGTGSVFDTTIDAVSDWAANVGSRGIRIVPISALVREPEPSKVANGK